MKIEILEINGSHIAEVISDDTIISNTQEAVDMMMNCAYLGAESLLIHEHHLAPEFFDLKTGVAGEILQKFSTYQMRLSIVGDFEKFTSKSLKEFIFESNRRGNICFVGSRKQAREALSR